MHLNFNQKLNDICPVHPDGTFSNQFNQQVHIPNFKELLSNKINYKEQLNFSPVKKNVSKNFPPVSKNQTLFNGSTTKVELLGC